jgi:hypothetical protein
MKRKSRGPYRRKTIPRSLVTTVDGLPSSPRVASIRMAGGAMLTNVPVPADAVALMVNGHRVEIPGDAPALDPSVQLFLYGIAITPAKAAS